MSNIMERLKKESNTTVKPSIMHNPAYATKNLREAYDAKHPQKKQVRDELHEMMQKGLDKPKSVFDKYKKDKP